MAKTIADVLSEIQAPVGKSGKATVGRFSKSKYNDLLKAAINDVDFSIMKAVYKDETLTEEEVKATTAFREFLHKVLVKAGMDKNDANVVLSKEFEISNVDGVYEFFVATVQEYLKSGNKFDFIPTKEFKGSIHTKEVAESKKVVEGRNPKTNESCGTFETTKQKHTRLVAQSPCPDWLKGRLKIKD